MAKLFAIILCLMYCIKIVTINAGIGSRVYSRFDHQQTKCLTASCCSTAKPIVLEGTVLNDDEVGNNINLTINNTSSFDDSSINSVCIEEY